MDQECKVCAKSIKGRSDKIFCSFYCKNVYHKKIRYASKVAAIEINGYLKRNYAILLEALTQNKVQIKIYRNLLEKKGFRFKYHTHFHVNSKSKTLFYVYDIAWIEFSDDEILVIRRI